MFAFNYSALYTFGRKDPLAVFVFTAIGAQVGYWAAFVYHNREKRRLEHRTHRH